MRKKDYIEKYEIIRKEFSSLHDQLTELVEKDLLGTGWAFFIYNPYQYYSYKRINEILFKATMSKDYSKYMKRVRTVELDILISEVEEEVKKTKDIINKFSRLGQDGYINIHESEVSFYKERIPETTEYDIWEDNVGNISIELK